MEGLQARVDSFKKSKRVKNPNKGSATISLKWPHPSNFSARPETLADAGFYYSPSAEDPDNVTCFVCTKELSGWDDDDDPFDLHYLKCAETCCWANIQCGLKTDVDKSGRFVFPNKLRLPNHKAMEKSRLDTFGLGKGWLHDKTRNHGANSRSMARAGFVYTPMEAGDDLATCLYCSVSLSGWDEDDDPMEEHRRRADKFEDGCPFFNHSDPPSSKPSPRSTSQAIKPPSKSQSKPPSRSTSRTKHEDVLLPTKVFDGEDDESDEPAVKPSKDSSAKTPRKPRSNSGSRKSYAKTPKAKSRSTSRTALKDVLEEEEVEVEEILEPPPTAKKRGRPRSKSVAKQDDVAPEGVEDEPPVITKKTRSRSKSVALSELPSNEDDIPVKLPRTKSRAKAKAPNEEPPEQEDEEVLRKSSRSRKPKLSVAPVPEDASQKQMMRKTRAHTEPDEEEPQQVVVEPKPTAIKGHKRTVSRSKPKAPIPKSQELDEEEVPPAPSKSIKAGSTRLKATSKDVTDARNLFNDETVMETYLPPPSDATDSPSTTTEMAPLFVPKRVAKSSSLAQMSSNNSNTALNPPEKDKRKPGRPPKTKPSSAVSDSLSIRPAQNEQVEETVSKVKTEISEAPIVRPKPKPKSKTPQLKMKVVEISSDEDDDELEDEMNKELLEPPASQQDVFGPQTVNSSQQPSSESPLQPRTSGHNQNHDREPETTPTHKHVEVPEAVTPLREEPETEDIVMKEHLDEKEPDMQHSDEDAGMETAPSTPPRPRTPATQPIAPTVKKPPKSAEPQFIPPLARLPFMPLHMLSEAELDMTVEEWIRYQIEVEQDRFKRDGERELERFKKRAEEVRKAIESL
ncbi:hypothetical protein CPB83DRAFT_795521 [Crepidotus variabilis]|uniref:Protein bir1 n=1 Tax=Crepidotus variabilis TaxID=179855 RepID=A0A9P6EBS8_9AGAR|nr:hypothetical protein CPB83DRAFT_795521 [Crepidotus variabilis]